MSSKDIDSSCSLIFRLAASSGDKDSCVQMGIILRDGQGAEKDSREAVDFFRRAADDGHSEGKLLLGLCYHRGEGVEKNLDEAMRLFREAVD